jgi:hypothetical protein
MKILRGNAKASFSPGRKTAFLMKCAFTGAYKNFPLEAVAIMHSIPEGFLFDSIR